MPVAGVIAEFNPLHNGHVYLLSQAKQFAGDGVVVVMSGNFTQRADLALLSSRWRTKMLPARTYCPSARLVPKRCAWLSRPFFEEPIPFL